MKPFLALIAGFLTASILFASGALLTMNLVMTGPGKSLDSGNTALWSAPVKSGDETPRILVASASAGKMPASSLPGARQEAASNETRLPADGVQSASLSGQTDHSQPLVRSDEHVAWCSRQYRSYRPETDSYRSYGGAIRPCISPYSDSLTTTADTEASIIYISGEASAVSDEHIRACMSRYRSYRAEDNSYQPYGGGPRRQCD